MKEFYFQSHNECLFLASSEITSQKVTLLFVHGLGDSSISYMPYLDMDTLSEFNILIPDLLGYGRSSSSDDYSFEHQVNGIVNQILNLESSLQIDLNNIVLIAHSMGSIHATLLCESILKNRIKAFVNVEGSITQYGSFISETVMGIAENNRMSWFDNFKQSIYPEGIKTLSMRSYYASLLFCQPQAFIQNAIEMRELSIALHNEFSSIMGERYADLSLPKIYCYGDSLAKETLKFLDQNQLEKKYFPSPNHFLMSECKAQFSLFLRAYAVSLDGN